MSLDFPYFAAVELGSNSFHMVVARLQDGKLEIVDREKEMVQLARGTKSDGHLSVAAQTRALEYLNRFTERLRDIPAGNIRAVGTKSFRSANRSATFVRQGEKNLGILCKHCGSSLISGVIFLRISLQ